MAFTLFVHPDLSYFKFIIIYQLYLFQQNFICLVEKYIYIYIYIYINKFILYYNITYSNKKKLELS